MRVELDDHDSAMSMHVIESSAGSGEYQVRCPRCGQSYGPQPSQGEVVNWCHKHGRERHRQAGASSVPAWMRQPPREAPRPGPQTRPGTDRPGEFYRSSPYR